MKPYNPLEKQHLAEQIARVLLDRPRERLGSIESFEGAGVYVIYSATAFSLGHDSPRQTVWAARLQPNRKEAELLERYGAGRR